MKESLWLLYHPIGRLYSLWSLLPVLRLIQFTFYHQTSPRAKLSVRLLLPSTKPLERRVGRKSKKPGFLAQRRWIAWGVGSRFFIRRNSHSRWPRGRTWTSQWSHPPLGAWQSGVRREYARQRRDEWPAP